MSCLTLTLLLSGVMQKNILNNTLTPSQVHIIISTNDEDAPW